MPVSCPLSLRGAVHLAMVGHPVKTVDVPPLDGLHDEPAVESASVHIVQGSQGLQIVVADEGMCCGPALEKPGSSPSRGSPNGPECHAIPQPNQRASSPGRGTSSSPEGRASPSPCPVPAELISFRLSPDFDLGSMSPPCPPEHPTSTPQPRPWTHSLQHTPPMTPPSQKYPVIQHCPQHQQQQQRSPESLPSRDPSLNPSLDPMQSPQPLCRPPSQPCLQGNSQSDRHWHGSQTPLSLHAQPAQQVDQGQQIAQTPPCSSPLNQIMSPSELADRAGHPSALSPAPMAQHSPGPTCRPGLDHNRALSPSSRAEHSPALSPGPRAERSPALSPGTLHSYMPAARRGPRIKTTVRTGKSGQAQGPAVKVVATGRVLVFEGHPEAKSSSPTAQSPHPQPTLPNPAAKRLNPEASVSGTTLTLAHSGSPSSNATLGGRRKQRPATEDLDCSERLEAESLPTQSAYFHQHSDEVLHADDNAQHHQCIGNGLRRPRISQWQQLEQLSELLDFSKTT